MKLNTKPNQISYTDNAELDSKISKLYIEILQKYNFASYDKEEMYHWDTVIWHHVRHKFMENYAKDVVKYVTPADELLEAIKPKEKPYSEVFDARVELYTRIINLFQEYGGIPKQRISNNVIGAICFTQIYFRACPHTVYSMVSVKTNNLPTP